MMQVIMTVSIHIIQKICVSILVKDPIAPMAEKSPRLSLKVHRNSPKWRPTAWYSLAGPFGSIVLT